MDERFFTAFSNTSSTRKNTRVRSYRYILCLIMPSTITQCNCSTCRMEYMEKMQNKDVGVATVQMNDVIILDSMQSDKDVETLSDCSFCGKTFASRQSVRSHMEKYNVHVPVVQGKVDPDSLMKPRDFMRQDSFVELRESIQHDNRVYFEKRSLGRRVAVILAEGVIEEESLTQERRDALEFYKKTL